MENVELNLKIKKQSFTDVFQNRLFLKCRSILRKTPVWGSLLNKDIRNNFINKRLQHMCFSVRIAKSLRTALFNIYLLIYFKLTNLQKHSIHIYIKKPGKLGKLSQLSNITVKQTNMIKTKAKGQK